jgi:hypothetical protein
VVLSVRSVPWDSDPRFTLVGMVSSNVLIDQSVESCNLRFVVGQLPAGTDMSTETEESFVRSSYLVTTGEDIRNFMSAALH